MNKLNLILLVLLAFSILAPALAEEQCEEKITCIYYFYGHGCPHCAKVDPYIEKLEYNPNLEIHKFEIYNNRSNVVLLQKFYDNLNVPQEERGIPTVFIGTDHLVGDQPISENLNSFIAEHEGAKCPSPNGETPLKSVSLGVILGAALVDSINPCAIAVLLILLGSLLIAGDKKRALKSGLAFTISIYVVYLLFGLGLFSAIKVSGLSFWFYKFVGALAIILGILNIKDFLWYRAGGFATEIPFSWRPFLKKLLRSVTSPLGAFVLGFLVCLFELPCTGGPYFFVLGLLAEKTTQAAAIPILLLYNLVFILPLLLITLALYFGFTSVEKTEEWKERNLKRLHLVAGVIMLVLGIVVVLGLI